MKKLLVALMLCTFTAGYCEKRPIVSEHPPKRDRNENGRRDTNDKERKQRDRCCVVRTKKGGVVKTQKGNDVVLKNKKGTN